MIGVLVIAITTSYNFLAVPILKNIEIKREKVEREKTIEAAFRNNESIASEGFTITDVKCVYSFEEANALNLDNPVSPKIKRMIENPRIEIDSHQLIVVENKELGSYLTLMIQLNGEWRLFIP